MDLLLDKVQLRGHVDGMKEWNEGFEELQAIQYSFAIQFKDGQGAWSLFSDSEEEKVRTLGNSTFQADLELLLGKTPRSSVSSHWIILVIPGSPFPSLLILTLVSSRITSHLGVL
jgi:hypothetical protein